MAGTIEQNVETEQVTESTATVKTEPWQPRSQFDRPPAWWETMSVEQKLELAEKMPAMNTGSVCQ